MIRDPFLRRVTVAISIVSPLFLAIAGLSAIIRYEPWGVPKAHREAFKEKRAAVLQKIENVKSAHDAGIYPAVEVIGDSEFDFGYADPHSTLEHTFSLKNIGNATLELTAGETTCKCTLSDVEARFVEPGEATEVTLTFNTGRKRSHYQQTAIIKTNDPGRPEILLRVEGIIRQELSVEPAEAHFEMVAGGQRECQFEIISELWDDFDLMGLSSDLEGVSWTIAPLERSRLDQLNARSGWRLVARVLGDRPRGYYSGVITGKAINRGEPIISEPLERADAESNEATATERMTDEKLFELPIRGRIVSPIVLYGADLDRNDGFTVGTLVQGDERQLKGIVAVRGPKMPTVLEIGDVSPSFLRAALEPMTRDGYYTLQLTIPADATQTRFNGEQKGYIEIRSDLLDDGRMYVPVDGTVIAKINSSRRNLTE